MNDDSQGKTSDSPLGKPVDYQDQYQPDLLFAIPRVDKRIELGIQNSLPFREGGDIWNAYELSWLNPNGLPQVAMAEFHFNMDSPNIIESKSFKLYLNSFNQSRFRSMQSVASQIQRDLEAVTQSKVQVILSELDRSTATVNSSQFNISQWQPICLENQAFAKQMQIKTYQYDPDLLVLDASGETVSESLCSHLLKSNCLITNQPDWASLYIEYKGAKINHQALLAYIVSFRSHNEFHEQCVERIFVDIIKRCKPVNLTVYARYTRRGGLDINPWRSTNRSSMPNHRQIRQ